MPGGAEFCDGRARRRAVSSAALLLALPSCLRLATLGDATARASDWERMPRGMASPRIACALDRRRALRALRLPGSGMWERMQDARKTAGHVAGCALR